MRVPRSGWIIILYTMFVTSATASAQGLEHAEVRGTVRDGSAGAVRRASVTLSGTGLIGGPRTLDTDERGTYRFMALLPGTYSLRVEAPGFTPAVRERIVLPLATAATIDIELNVAQVQETLDVVAHGYVIDVRSSAVVTTLDENLLQSLPTVRSVPDALALAPGLFNPTSAPGLVVAFGGTIGSNGLYLDGVDLTAPRTQSAWLPVSYNWLDQMQITALGADAEYGEFTGAIGNAVLRSGGNRFSALAEYWTTQPQWIGRNRPSLAGREILAWWDSSAQVGGPIRRDRLWFFGGLEYFRHEDTPLGYREAARSQRTPLAIVKLTHALSADSRIEGHLQRNSSTTSGANAGPTVALEALNQIRQSDTSWSVRLTKPLGTRTLLEMRHGGYASNWHDDPFAPRTRDGPSPIIEGNMLRGTSNVYQDNRPVQVETVATVSRQIPRFLGGAHDVQVGLGLKLSSQFKALGFPGGRRLFFSGGQLASVTAWSGDRTQARGQRTAVYLQDRWQVHDRLTLNLGLRADFNRGSVPSGGTVLATNPLSPRAGLAWAVDQSYSTALKFHYGRYYDALLTERVAFMDVPGIGSTVAYTVSPSGELIEFFRSAPPNARAIDPNLRHSYADQYVIAIERRVYQQALFQALFIRRNYANFMAMTDPGSRWTPVELRDPGPDGVLETADDGGSFTAFQQVNPGQQFLFYTNPPDAFRRYTALQLVLMKRWTDNWQLRASYTLSKTAATVGNGDFTNAGLNDTGEHTGTNNPSVFMSPNGGINAEGRAVFDKNEFKVLGIYRVPVLGGVNVSGILWRQSGTRWERSIRDFNTLVPTNFQTIRVEPRGSRVTDPVWNLDVRIEPTIRMPLGPGTVGIAFDVFNTTNQGTPLSLNPLSGRSFGAPFTRSNPRMLRLLTRWRW